MGNFRCRLSHMMPNAWFYKLKDMRKLTNHPTKKNISKHSEQNQAYFYYTTETINKEKHSKISDIQIPEPSRKSSKKTRRKTIYKPSPRQIHARNLSDSSTESSTELDFTKTSSFEFESDILDGFNGLMSSWSSSCNCRISSSTADIIIDINENQYKPIFENFHEFSELNLPPIQTKLPTPNDSAELYAFRYNNNFSEILKNMKIKKEKENAPVLQRKSIGVKVRTKSPKLASKKFQKKSRKSVSLEKVSRTEKKTFLGSFAVVKASIDPEEDFRDSMIEMIVENNLRTSKELEDLLACFLSLNSDEYHDVIIKAFEKIWFSMSKIYL